MGVISEFGAFLDPVADKLMVAAALVLLCTRPLAMPWARLHPWILPLPAIAIIGREITMSALREWAASQGGNLHKVFALLAGNLFFCRLSWPTLWLCLPVTSRLGTENWYVG
jgi:CDP-diacylglycerol--glycerol-3-phosphate 3-phosphatidyltransferase